LASDVGTTGSDAGTVDAAMNADTEDASSGDDVAVDIDMAPAADAGSDGGTVADMAGNDATIDAGPDADLPPPNDDPFDPASCSAAPWAAADALARLGGASDELLDSQIVMRRTRSCDAAGCGPWSDPEQTVVSFLTWSGSTPTITTAASRSAFRRK
jgi:hypothetical protein